MTYPEVVLLILQFPESNGPGSFDSLIQLQALISISSYCYLGYNTDSNMGTVCIIVNECEGLRASQRSSMNIILEV